MKLIESIKITGQIKVLTGLHIGAGKDAVEIGGVDNPVVKNPITGEPYIPGSSLKGKLRCLMEWATGKVNHDGKVWDGNTNDEEQLAKDPVLRIFGTTHKSWKAGPTRLIVRDCFLHKEWKDEIIERGLPFTEEKFENNIDRIQGKAGVGIRKTERVPAGAIFDFAMIFRMFDCGDKGEMDKNNIQKLYAVMKLLEQDALGGYGSRGYGRIKFEKVQKNGTDVQQELDIIEIEKVLQAQ